MYYFRYFLKCCIRNIARLVCKPKILFTVLAIILLLFCFTKLESNAAETEKTPLNVEYLESRTIGGNINSTTMQGQIVDFGGFYCYFAPIDYKGQTVGFNVQTSQTCEVRYGFAEYVSVGTPVYYFGQTTTSEVGNIATKTNITCPIDKGFFIVCVYQGYAVTNISMYSQDTVAEIVGNSTQTILEGQQQLRDDILQGQNEINDTLTSTDYDENTINVDTSSLDNLEENSDILTYPMRLVEKLSDVISTDDWNSVQTIEIGVPHSDEKIVLRSDMLYNFIKDSAFYDLLQLFWVYVFGRYFIAFGLRIYHWLRTGEAVRKPFNLDTEAITASLM